MAIISLIGVSECYNANGGPKGADFIRRLFVIGVPVGIKFAIASMALGQIAYFGFPSVVTTASFRDPGYVYELFLFAFSTVFMALYYWRIATHLTHVLERQRSNTPVNPTSQ